MAVMAGSTVSADYAGFWKRFAAALVDGVIISVIDSILFRLLGGAGSGIGLLVFLGYFTYFESSERQATPGKMLLGIKVIDLEGNRLTPGRALGRNAAKILSAIIFFIGYIMAAFTARNQALHDLIANTLVIKT